MGVELDSLEEVAYLVGIKTVANEFQAYKELGELINQNKLSVSLKYFSAETSKEPFTIFNKSITTFD